MTLYDISTEHDYDGIELSIFRPKDNIPEVNAADVVLLFQVKVQRWNSNPISLITNNRTIISVYSAAKIPKYPRPAGNALQARAGKENVKAPFEIDNIYVSYFYNTIDKGAVPEQEEFQLMATRAVNVKQKFSLLQDVSESKFCDIIVQVCRDIYDLGDRITLYVSDYTENDSFFNYTYEGIQDLDSGSSDMYGYTSKRRDSDTANKWVGPYGKKAMQVTCWEPHASIIREEVKAGDWVSLRNVQIKMGRDGNNLEGALREERNQPITAKVNVAVLETHDKDTIDPRLKDAIRRWRDYTKEKNKQVKTLKASEGKRKYTPDDTDDTSKRNSKAQASEGKRKHTTDDTDESGKPNSKARRKRQRAEAYKKVEEQETKLKEEVLGLNPLIVCETPPEPAFSQVASIVEQQYQQTTIDGNQIMLPLPFVCAKYCANVRVVDFHPTRLEHFARPRKVNAFDILSDNSGSEATSSSEEEDDDDDDDTIRVGHETVWEWRFALQLEEASPKAEEPKRVWVLVNNMEAQCLTGLDAADLRKDEATLATLREKLFTLWGEVEERKHWQLNQKAEARKRKPGAAPPPTMSDDEDGGRRRVSTAKKTDVPVVSNKPFTCCIRQYAVRRKESDLALADAGDGHRWQRMFGLFGTKIGS
ncbi:hypothetical protein CONLIGDRAFT_631796 [Coniochaeta ligniaria NRRL 30616]|uniref:Protection of telomeres protein 1 ssDNA-binding domain-containing protein n=1 Tax=Coniochaeta ligniaria NRRL 30616 TaxID=1408157 RepID=A0A1J7IQG3_9PEZI|nr:hypothetical protein CONLIGDRAFT_631796 [Coniochaeta ligniaria NRRL 30616]